MEYEIVPPPAHVSQEFQPDICSILLMVVLAGVDGAGVGVAVGAAGIVVAACWLLLEVEVPPPPHPVIEITARASTPNLRARVEMDCIYCP